MNKQPDQYKLGATLYDLGIHEWWLWRSKKSVLCPCNDCRNDAHKQAKDAWLNETKQALLSDVGLHGSKDRIHSIWWELIGNGDNAIVPQDQILHHSYNRLFASIKSGDAEACAQALEIPHLDVGIEDVHGYTSLHHALRSGKIEVARVVLSHNPASLLRIFPRYDLLCNVTTALRRHWTWLPDNIGIVYRSQNTLGYF